MNAVLLTILALGGTSGATYRISDAGVTQPPVPIQASVSDAGYASVSDGGYAPCGGVGHGHYRGGHAHRPHFMMPQTCYNPRFGCYDGDRYNHRYPAFHGRFYRKPYTYRDLFDYPWHAEPHEPTSLFSYNVSDQPVPAPVAAPPVPVPVPAPAVQHTYPAPQYRAASHSGARPMPRPATYQLLRSLRR